MFAFYGATSLYAQAPEEVKVITKDYNIALLNSLAKESAEKALRDKAEAVAFARRNGLPLIIQNDDNTISELVRVEQNVPIYLKGYNVDAAISTRANFLNPGGG